MMQPKCAACLPQRSALDFAIVTQVDHSLLTALLKPQTSSATLLKAQVLIIKSPFSCSVACSPNQFTDSNNTQR